MMRDPAGHENHIKIQYNFVDMYGVTELIVRDG